MPEAGAIHSINAVTMLCIHDPGRAELVALAPDQTRKGALMLDQVPLKRCQDNLAVIVHRQIDATSDQIIKAVLDFCTWVADRARPDGKVH